MAVAYTIPAQKVDGYDVPSTVFTVYTGDITVGSSEPMHFDNILLAVALTQPDTDNYMVLQASRTTFSSFSSPSTYTYDGKTVYYIIFPWRPTAITFSPDLPTNVKTANTERNSISPYAAWLMVYGGYIATFSELEETANAIRAKTGSSAAIEWEAGEGFKDAIAAIQTGVDGLEYALHFSSPSSFTLETGYRSANWDGSIEWTDGAHAWAVWDGNAILTASSGVLYLRGINNTGITGSSNQFVLTGTNISCDGNIETLLDYATVALGNHPTMDSYCYAYLFQNCTSLISAPDLLATTLTEECYSSMFSGCSNLKSAPIIAATTLTGDYCCSNMFYNCTSLISAPALLATTLADNCYDSMFAGCTSLKSAPALPATTLATSCYSSMFEGCASLTSAPALPATTLARGCYQWMFEGCTGLTSSPALPAITLAQSCYQAMFQGCTSLTSPPALPATTLTQSCYQEMFKDCTALASLPLLPATTLTNYCYYQMFYGCTGIKLSQAQDSTYYPYAFRIPESGTGTEETTSLINMFAGTGGSWSGQPIVNRIYYLRKPLPIDFTIDSNATAADVRLGKIAYANGARISGSLANGTATAPASISGTGASVSTGTNTLTLSKTVSATPQVTAGYITSGTAGNSSVSLTASVTTKAAATYTPTTSNQTIAAGTYLTGAQTIAGNANLVAGNIKSGVSIFGVTGTFAGDATVYKDAWTSKGTPEKNSQIITTKSSRYPGAATTVGDYAIFAGGTPAGETSPSTDVDFFSKNLTHSVASSGLVTAVGGLAATTIGNYALFGGGGYSNVSYSTVTAYSNTLTRSTPTALSASRRDLAATAVGNYALFGSGYNIYYSTYETTVDSYNTSLTKGTATGLTNGVRYLMAGHIGDYALFAGGTGSSGYSTAVTAYNTSLTKSTPTALSAAKENGAATTAGNYLLFGGGYNASGRQNVVNAYNTSLTRSIPTALSVARTQLTATSLETYGLFGGGSGSTTDEGKTVDAYNSSLTRSTPTVFSLSRYQHSATTIGGYALFALGWNGSNTVEIYNLPYTLTVSVPANYTYTFNGETPVTVSSTTSITKTNAAPINGVVCKAATTRTGQIT